MRCHKRAGRALSFVIVLVACGAVVAALVPFGLTIMYGARTIHELLTENRRLKEAITNLTREEQIGYAKVVQQERREGTLYTRLRFVQTARGNPLRRVLQKEVTIQGDVVHFDALIVRFDDRMVMDGRERALYIWRRVYGEHMAPKDGIPVETPGAVPARYSDLLQNLRDQEQAMFWDAVWDLANDPGRLAEYGIKAVYGSAPYTQLRPGHVYLFKISPTGQVYPEVTLDM